MKIFIWLKYMTVMTMRNISNRAGLPENPKVNNTGHPK